MAFKNPNDLDVFIRAEPTVSLLGKKNTTALNVFRRSEPAASVLVFTESVEGSIMWIKA